MNRKELTKTFMMISNLRKTLVAIVCIKVFKGLRVKYIRLFSSMFEMSPKLIK